MRSIESMMSLEGRVSVVTGGAGHIGRELCATLAELGAAVVVVDLSQSRCNVVAEELAEQYGVRALGLAADLENEAAVQAVPDQVVEWCGGLDILVNCAAFVGSSDLEGWATGFEAQRADTWRRALEVNLTAPFLLTQASLPALRRGGHGSIINLGSIYGILGPDWRLYEGTGMGNPAAYAASKGGLLQLTRWLASTLAPEIRVNAIVPGGLLRGQAETFISRYIARTPLRRMGREDDLKGAAAYLASDLSAYVTGQHIVVDGGWSVW